MPQSLANFDAALKDDYGPGLRNAINNSNPILTEVATNTEDIVGRKAVWSVHTGRSNSTGARAELGTLPSADRQRFNQMSEDLAYLYHTIKVSGQAKALTRNDTGSFARALETELRGGEKDIKIDFARQLVGQSISIGGSPRTGLIAKLSADPGTGTTLTFAAEPQSVMRHFYRGMLIEFRTTAGALVVGGTREVASVDSAARTVTITAAADAAVASTDYVTRAGNYDAEINGLRHLINATSVFAGVDPATVPEWAAMTAGSSTTGISEVLLETATETVETDGDGSTPTLFLVEHSQRRKLASQMQSQKRYEGREMTLTAGWKGLQIAQGVLVVDRFVPTTLGFGVTKSELVQFVGLDWTWDDDDGKVLYKALDGSDAIEARFKSYRNMVATTRNAHVVITMSAPTF